jgi:hypothetical protein
MILTVLLAVQASEILVSGQWSHYVFLFLIPTTAATLTTVAQLIFAGNSTRVKLIIYKLNVLLTVHHSISVQ